MRRTVNFLSAKNRLYPLSCKGYRRIVPSRAQVRACTRVRGHTRPRARVVVSKNSTAFRPEENSRASTAYSVFPVLPGGRRPRKVRLAPFPPVEIGQPSGALLPYGCRIPLAGKTPPASLHPKGTSAPLFGAWALVLFPPDPLRWAPAGTLLRFSGRMYRMYWDRPGWYASRNSSTPPFGTRTSASLMAIRSFGSTRSRFRLEMYFL